MTDLDLDELDRRYKLYGPAAHVWIMNAYPQLSARLRELEKHNRELQRRADRLATGKPIESDCLTLEDDNALLRAELEAVKRERDKWRESALTAGASLVKRINGP